MNKVYRNRLDVEIVNKVNTRKKLTNTIHPDHHQTSAKPSIIAYLKLKCKSCLRIILRPAYRSIKLRSKLLFFRIRNFMNAPLRQELAQHRNMLNMLIDQQALLISVHYRQSKTIQTLLTFIDTNRNNAT